MLCILLLGISACNMGSLKGSGIPENKKDYIGLWTSPEIMLNISENGQVEYEKHTGSMKTSVNGPIQEFKGKDFTVGAFGINTTFKVSRPPHEENGTWKMTVDGQELTRQ